MKILPAIASLLTAGCLAHRPADPDPVHLRIRWCSNFDQAAVLAAESRKPLLVCLVAGDLQDDC